MTTVIVGIRVRFLGAPGEEFSKVDLSHVASMVPYYQGVGVERGASSFIMQVMLQHSSAHSSVVQGHVEVQMGVSQSDPPKEQEAVRLKLKWAASSKVETRLQCELSRELAEGYRQICTGLI